MASRTESSASVSASTSKTSGGDSVADRVSRARPEESPARRRAGFPRSRLSRPALTMAEDALMSTRIMPPQLGDNGDELPRCEPYSDHPERTAGAAGALRSPPMPLRGHRASEGPAL